VKFTDPETTGLEQGDGSVVSILDWIREQLEGFAAFFF